MHIRQNISDELEAFCDVQSIWEVWDGKESGYAIVVLGECGSYMK